MCRNIANPRVKFLGEAHSNLGWLERNFALLVPENPDYETEKRAIEAAMRELRELIQIVRPKSTGAL